MTSQTKARQFADLHVSGNPLILCNIWDAGSARIVAESGAKAIASGSWAIANAQGYADGENMPFEQVMTTLHQIVSVTDLPVTLDFETGYAETLDELRSNVARVISAGAVGINFEDQILGGPGLVAISDQCDRIAAIRTQANDSGVPLFINARTDTFFIGTHPQDHPELVPAAVERASAYAVAGANGLFVPGLGDTNLIRKLCESVELPVNVMAVPGGPGISELSECGVARVSHGPGPYRAVLAALAKQAAAMN